MPLVECVPNFSEGRRLDIVQKIVDAIASANVHILDYSSDADHNRSVITFAGEPQQVVEAAVRGAHEAAQHINLDIHQGVHPRIGAADVIPFIPLRGISLEDCAALARDAGRRIADELGIPVYLYEAAAIRPERRNLAYVRRDPYEALKHTIHADPDRTPDYGTARLGTAGASAVGARMPLIAFNVYLNTPDVEIARSIARAIRESGGGLPYLKALGLKVKGMAQVSLNVIDYRQTGLFEIFEALHTQVSAHGVEIVESELIGLIPQNALLDCALSYLKLPALARSQVLEHRVGAATGDYRELPFE